MDVIPLIEELIKAQQKLRSKVNELNLKLKLETVPKDEFHEKISEIKKEVKSLKENLNDVKKIIEDLKKEHDYIINKNASLLRELKEKYTNVLTTEDYVKILDELDSLKNEVELIKEDLKKLQELEEIKNGLQKVRVLEREVENLRELKEVGFEISKIYSELEEVKSSIKEFEEYSKRLENYVIALEKRLEDRPKEIIIKEKINSNDIKRLEESIKEFENKFLEIEKRINILETLVDALRSGSREIKEEVLKNIKSLKDEIKKLKEEGVTKEIKDIYDIIYALSKENDKLKEKIKELEMKLKILNAEEVTEAFERIRILEEKLKGIENIKDFAWKIYQLESMIKKLYERQAYLEQLLKKT